MQVTRVGNLTAGNGAIGGNQASSLRYLHHDQLGSIAAISNEAGAVIESLAYDPWGKRRYSNGTADSSDAILGQTTDRGFTMHEHLDEMGIIHMNGRVYDPLIGRFMSADPYIQAPDMLQSYNRYAYVMNNSLNLTDPSGYWSLRGAWRSIWHNRIVQTVVTIAIAVYAGLGAAAAYTGARTWNATGSFEQGLKAGLISYATAIAFNEVGNLGLGSGSGANILAHAAVGCASSAASGGSCRSGALSAAFAEAIGPHVPKFDSLAANVTIRAIVGGAGSVAGGGKFENGAVTGAFGYLFNELQHARGTARQKMQSAGYAETGPYSDGSYCNIQGSSGSCGYPGSTRADHLPMTLQLGVTGQAGGWVFGASQEFGVAIPTSLNDICIYAQTCVIVGPQSVLSASGAVSLGQGAPSSGSQVSHGGTWFGGQGAFGSGQLTVNQGGDKQGTRGVVRGGVGSGAGAGYVTCNQGTMCLVK